MKILPCGLAVIEGDQWASRWIEEQGKLDYDPTISKVIEPLLNPGDTAIDVGAMIGAYSFGMKRAVGPDGRMISFEPNLEALACLQHNCPDVESHDFALGRHCMSVGIKRHEANPGKSWIMEKWESGDRIIMEMLDVVLGIWNVKGVNLIKIDVEGMEPDVIVGGIKTIEKFRPFIFMEVNHRLLGYRGYTYKDSVGLLMDMDYTPRHLKEGLSFDKEKCPEIDVLMIP